MMNTLRKIVLLLSLLAPTTSFAAIAFVQLVTPWGGGQPIASGSFTASAGDIILTYGGDVSGVSHTVAYSGTGTYSILTPPGQQFSNFIALATALNSSATAGAQTVTVSSNSSGDFSVGMALEYSGVSSVSSSETLPNTPGTGAGAIQGTAVTVPTGSILVAICLDNHSTTVPTATAGTSRGSGVVATSFGYAIAEYAGAGSSITPSFTSAAGGTSQFSVVQWVLTPSGGSTVKPSNFFFATTAPVATPFLQALEGEPRAVQAWAISRVSASQ